MFQGIPSLMIAGIQSSATGSSLLTGLNVYYKLEDVSDSSGNSQTLTNNNTVTFVAGKVNNGANFVAASNQSLTVNDSTSFQMGTSDISICGWFKAATGDLNRRCMATYGSAAGGTTRYGFFRWDESLHVFLNDNAGHGVAADFTPYFDNTFHFVVITYARASNMTTYVDNVQVGSNDITAVTGLVNTTGGTDGFNMGEQIDAAFNGMLDEVGIWSRVLTGTEITTLWNSGAGKTYPFS